MLLKNEWVNNVIKEFERYPETNENVTQNIWNTVKVL